MGLAPYIYADRRLPDEEAVRETLAGRSLTKFGDDEQLERLHRVFYPVFRVEYRYETGEGKLLGTEEKTATALLDGLWEDNDAELSRYAEGTDELVRRSTSDYDFGANTPTLGRSVLMQFQVPTDEAESLLPRRIEEYREQQGTTANVFLRKLRDSYGLPGDFDPEGFDAVTDIERCYLPFWLAEFHSPHSADIALVSFRDPDASAEEMRQHGWLSAFVSEQPRRLATFGYEADPDRVERAIRERVGQTGGAPAPAERAPPVAASPAARAPRAPRRSTARARVTASPTASPRSSSPTASIWRPRASSTRTPTGVSPTSAG
ncbi:hypothetical protein [Haloarcula rara]|uniref:hypothetical protein n=1 Tax=Haloarcula rara TaxID=3033387 RepID=UPI0023E84715|nr:hypothetical protein [Halomicroarcula sp. SHR3]